MKVKGNSSPKQGIASQAWRIIIKGIGLFFIFLCPALFQIALWFALDFEYRLVGVFWGTLVVSVLFCMFLLRAIGGKGFLKKWSTWIVVIPGLVFGIFLLLASSNVRLTSTLSTARCSQFIAAVQQCMLDTDKEWIYYDDIVGPDGYLQNVHKHFGGNPEDNFPMHRDAQEFMITLQNGWKIIWWSEVPIGACKSRPPILMVKPIGKLHVVYDAKEEAERYSDYLEWKKDYVPPVIIAR